MRVWGGVQCTRRRAWLGLVPIRFDALSRGMHSMWREIKTPYYHASNDENTPLQELNEPALQYLMQENNYVGEVIKAAVPESLLLDHCQSIRRYAEHDSGSSATLPERVGDYYYYTRQLAEADVFPAYFRLACPSQSVSEDNSMSRPNFLKGLTRAGNHREEMLLNPNQFFEASDYVHISSMKLSPDHRMLVFTVDTRGNECYKAVVKDLHTGEQTTFDCLSSVVSVEWGNIAAAACEIVAP